MSLTVFFLVYEHDACSKRHAAWCH